MVDVPDPLPPAATQPAAFLARGDEGDVRVVVRVGVRTDVGRRREHNEDSYGARFPFYVVADGMGGHQAGDVASATVIGELLGGAPPGHFATAADLSSAIARAAERVSELGVGLPVDQRAPGSTLTGLAFSTHRSMPCARVFNIGDSRTYLLSGSEFSQITTDHSEVQEMLDSGAVNAVQARALPHRNVITRALGAGSGPRVLADLSVVPASAGDRYLMCSDGLSGEVTDALIEMVMRTLADPQRVADELVSMALTAGGKDNVTVMVVDVVDADPSWNFDPADGTTVNSDDTVGGNPDIAFVDDDTIPTRHVADAAVVGPGRAGDEEDLP